MTADTIRTAFAIRTETNLTLKSMAARESVESGVRVTPSDIVQRILDESLPQPEHPRRGKGRAKAA